VPADETQATTAVALQWKRSPVWTGEQAGPKDKNGRSWYDPLFDDASWTTVALPDSGNDGELNDRYYRSHFLWDGVSPTTIQLAADDGLAIYINGKTLGSWGNGWRKLGCVNNPNSQCSVSVPVPAQKIPTTLLKRGDNVIAVDLWNGACCGYYLNIAVTGLIPSARPPNLLLPWPGGGIWYYTGGPHCDERKPQETCPSGAVRHAIDFSPLEQKTCPAGNHPEIKLTNRWVVAAAPGKVVKWSPSQIEIQHQGGLRTGYGHLADLQVKLGDPITKGKQLGHPSCAIEPGQRTTGIHLHFYFKFSTGELATKLPAHKQVLSGWTIYNAALNYDGTMTKQGHEKRTAYTGRCTPDRSEFKSCYQTKRIRNDLKSDNYP
jgi:hypothetical protein